MLGLEYGSDSDSSPPPSPKPKSQKAKAPKKVAISLPTISAQEGDDDDDMHEERPTKKRRTGLGSSALMAMLPVPKQATPVPLPQNKALGSGSGPGLVFKTTSNILQKLDEGLATTITQQPSEDLEPEASSSTSIAFRPASITKGRKNISLEEFNLNATTTRTSLPKPPADFFSLGQTSQAASTSFTLDAAPAVAHLSGVSSAPDIDNYDPPEPTPTDPYPGYYRLPSGSWAQYNADYYAKFMKKWQDEYDAHIRALEKGTVKGFEGLSNAAVENVNAAEEMEKAKKEVKEREDKKAITRGAGGGPVAPRMNINASKLSGIARSRHQLSTLLKEAYENREALEEKIAEGRRNRKEAGNKYGF